MFLQYHYGVYLLIYFSMVFFIDNFNIEVYFCMFYICFLRLMSYTTGIFCVAEFSFCMHFSVHYMAMDYLHCDYNVD